MTTNNYLFRRKTWNKYQKFIVYFDLQLNSTDEKIIRIQNSKNRNKLTVTFKKSEYMEYEEINSIADGIGLLQAIGNS